MTVTIKDLARMANVSHTTVSRALNDSPLIHPDTKERIRELAAQQGYQPNFNAKSLVLDRSYNIGLFFSTIHAGTSPGFFLETVRGVNEVIQDRYNLIVRGIDDYHNFAGITRKQFDGVLVMSQTPADDAFIVHLAEQDIHHVVLNRQHGGTDAINILSDDRQGAFALGDHMLRCGHRRIAIIEGKAGFKSTAERKEGFLMALKKHGVACPDAYQTGGDYELSGGYRAMRQLLFLKELPTAVFALNDEMAVGAMKAIAEHGLRVPDDISVAGFDDSEFSGYLSPALTTVRRQVERVGALGASRLLELIEKKDCIRETVRIETALILRDSVKCL